MLFHSNMQKKDPNDFFCVLDFSLLAKKNVCVFSIQCSFFIARPLRPPTDVRRSSSTRLAVSPSDPLFLLLLASPPPPGTAGHPRLRWCYRRLTINPPPVGAATSDNPNSMVTVTAGRTTASPSPLLLAPIKFSVKI
jgi:hypothetical protein